MKKGDKMEHINTTEMYYKVINCEEVDEIIDLLINFILF